MIVFRKSKQKEIEEFKEAVSQAMTSSKSRTTSKLLTNDLSELVDIFKSGEISKEEFDSQKELLIENL
jgi:hypothetical protein